MPHRSRHHPGPIDPSHVVVPVDTLEDYRLVLAAAAALTYALAHETVDEQALWLTRLAWAVEQMPASERDYYLAFAMAMEVEP